eukprot:1033959-Pyramimonas_sp.AAC.4
MCTSVGSEGVVINSGGGPWIGGVGTAPHNRGPPSQIRIFSRILDARHGPGLAPPTPGRISGAAIPRRGSSTMPGLARRSDEPSASGR